MEITFTCPHCGNDTLIEEKYIGQSGECRSCGQMVTVTSIVAPSDGSRAATRGCWSYAKYGLLALFCLIVLAILLPPMRHAGPAARRMSSGNNLKQIAMAMHNYHANHGQLPRAYWLTPSGERTLSWRVAILPFIEQQEVFDAYQVDQPWNSEANQLASNVTIPTYGNPGANFRTAETSYMVITGPGTVFEEGKDITFDDCSDGTANTILAVEVMGAGVKWGQPIDLDIRTMIFKINGGSSQGIGSPWKGGAQVVFADGSVRFLPNDMLESTLRAMITRNGGETFEMP